MTKISSNKILPNCLLVVKYIIKKIPFSPK
jgi:hypothetical protein